MRYPMKVRSDTKPRQIRAIKVNQWLDEWEKVHFQPKKYRAKPLAYFYLFSLDAHELKALSGIERRTTSGRLSQGEDLGIQRRHDPSRSDEIRRFVEFGYPWSELSEAKRNSGEYDDLRKPGWLPTAVVVNILGTNDRRRGRSVNRDDLVTIHEDGESSALLVLPRGFAGPDWRPSELPPIEVIDGQHRLWAFESDKATGKFEIPVVAFSGLDLSWQAYQFWTINIKPKRINPSLAFDLYPLLRTEDWLEKFEGHPIYRETRAQELVQHLWSQPESPWYQRINMLGESGLDRGMVSQASWIRSLMATFVRSRDKGRVGGLFGAPSAQRDEVLPWSRTQQAAFLILMGITVRDAVRGVQAEWAKEIRNGEAAGARRGKGDDPAFTSVVSLLTADVGIRGLLFVTNDLCYLDSGQLHLAEWSTDDSADPDAQSIAAAVRSLSKTDAGKFLHKMAAHLAQFDWRSSAAPGLTADEVTVKKTLRGSGGYREIRRLLLEHLSQAKDDVGATAKSALKVLKLS
jgi:DGQHR domain-containing protein